MKKDWMSYGSKAEVLKAICSSHKWQDKSLKERFLLIGLENGSDDTFLPYVLASLRRISEGEDPRLSRASKRFRKIIGRKVRSSYKKSLRRKESSE